MSHNEFEEEGEGLSPALGFKKQTMFRYKISTGVNRRMVSSTSLMKDLERTRVSIVTRARMVDRTICGWSQFNGKSCR